MRYNDIMFLQELDELAAEVAAGLDDGVTAPAALAARAYDIAEALISERHARSGGAHTALIDALPHEARWELSTRWNPAPNAVVSDNGKKAHLANMSSAVTGPGLASVKPARRDDAAEVG